MDSSASYLGGLPDLLASLCTLPSGDEAAAALVEGPGTVFDAGAATILVVDDGDLRVIGRFGYGSTDPDSRYRVADDLPVSRAVREGAVIVSLTAEAESEFADMRDAWRHAPELSTHHAVVSGPIVSNGVAIGGFALHCSTAPTLGSLDIALVDAIGQALALWLAHPGAVDPGATATEGDGPAVTSRQLAVLRLLATGRTTAAIAASLGCSASTVKVEVHRLSRALDAHGRADLVARARQHGLLSTTQQADGATSGAPW